MVSFRLDGQINFDSGYANQGPWSKAAAMIRVKHAANTSTVYAIW